jgi:hypothetical protein
MHSHFLGLTSSSSKAELEVRIRMFNEGHVSWRIITCAYEGFVLWRASYSYLGRGGGGGFGSGGVPAVLIGIVSSLVNSLLYCSGVLVAEKKIFGIGLKQLRVART